MAGRARTREARREGRICGAKNRRGLPCQCKLLYGGGKCKFHGGLSTGPKTEAGKLASAANLRKAWEKTRTSK